MPIFRGCFSADRPTNDIIFTHKKGASLYFISKMLKGAHLPNVNLNGVLFEQVDSMKYLGHFLTCELSDAVTFVVILLLFVCRKFHMCSVPVKLKLFNYYCSSLYTPHLWWNYKKMSVAKRQITYHNRGDRGGLTHGRVDFFELSGN